MKLQTQIIVAFVFGVTFVVALLVLAIKYPHPPPFLYNVFRVILALAAAGVAAMIPGFINIHVNPTAALSIRAGGALAIFVIVFFYTPAHLVTKDIGDYFFIVLERGDMLSGSASILINNVAVGELQVKPSSERDQLKVDLSNQGPVKYEIHGQKESFVYDENLNEIVHRITYDGQGTISPKPGETVYLKFLWRLEPGRAGIAIATLEHAPPPATSEDLRRALDRIVTELIDDPGDDLQAREKLMNFILENGDAMNLSEDLSFELAMHASDDEVIRHLIDKDLVSESVAVEYHALAPLGR